MTISYDPSNIVFTGVGHSYMSAHALAGTKGKVAYFKLSDTNLFSPTVADIAMMGNIVYTGQAVDIWFVQYSANEVIFRAIVDSSHGDFLIGSIGFFSDDNTLLFTAKFDYVHMKMKSTASSPGGRWTCQVRLIMQDIGNYWDFTNLTTRYAAMETHELANAPDYPFFSLYTELQLDDSFLPTNRAGYINLTGDGGRRWYCAPTQSAESNVIVFDRFDLDGGNVGDDHAGIW